MAIPFSMVMNLQVEPECPICRAQLYGKAIFVHKQVVVCKTCGATSTSRLLDLQVAASHCQWIKDHWSSTSGLVFFTPKSYAPSDEAAHLIQVRFNPLAPNKQHVEVNAES